MGGVREGNNCRNGKMIHSRNESTEVQTLGVIRIQL